MITKCAKSWNSWSINSADQEEWDEHEHSNTDTFLNTNIKIQIYVLCIDLYHLLHNQKKKITYGLPSVKIDYID